MVNTFCTLRGPLSAASINYHELVFAELYDWIWCRNWKEKHKMVGLLCVGLLSVGLLSVGFSDRFFNSENSHYPC